MEFPALKRRRLSRETALAARRKGRRLYSQASQRLKTLILQVNSWNFNILPKVKVEISISGSFRLSYIIPDIFGEILGIKKSFRKSQEF